MSRKITFVSKDQTQAHQSFAHDVSPMRSGVYDLGDTNHIWRSVTSETLTLTKSNPTAVLYGTNTGGSLEFKITSLSPTASQDLGSIGFGNLTSTQSKIQVINPSNWSPTNKETEMSFWGTDSNSTNMTKIGTWNNTGLEVNGQIIANTYYGDGSNLTGIVHPTTSPAGSTGSIQFKDSSNNFSGITRFVFDSTDERMSIGTPSFNAKLQIHDSIAPDPQTDVGNMSYYQLGISGTQSSNRGVGIAMGDPNNVGASIVFTDLGGESKGNLSFYTKNSTVTGAAPEERMVIRYDGNVGVGVSNPQSTFEVAPSVGLSNNSTDAGAFNFSVDTNTPTANSTLGTINFGSIAYKNAYIQTVNPTAWRLFTDNGGNHHQEMNFYATAQDGWNAELIVNMNADTGVTIQKGLDVTLNASFGADVNVTGDITANRVNGTTNVVGGALISNSTVTAAGNITSSTDISATGTVSGSALSTTGTVTALDVRSTDGTFTGTLTTNDLDVLGDIAAVNGVFSGSVSATNGYSSSTGSYTTTAGSFTTTNGNITTTNGSVIGSRLTSTGHVVATSGTVSAQNVDASVNITATGTVTGGSVVSTGNITASTGTISGGELSSSNNISANKSITAGLNITATGNVTGAFLYGDGSNITNLPIKNPGGSTTQLQYNNNGNFAGADIRQNTARQISINSTGDYAGYVTVSKAIGTNVNNSPHLAGNNHLVIKHDGTGTTGQGASLALADDTGITGQISSNISGSNAKGGLMFRVKNNTTANGTLDLSLSITDSLYSLVPSSFQQEVNVLGVLTALDTVVSYKTTDPQEEGSEVANYQLQARSNDSGSAGICFGNATQTGASIVAVPNSTTLNVADLNIKTRPTGASGMISNVYVKANSGNVGIGTTAPNYKLDVNGTTNTTELFVNNSLPTVNLTSSTILPTAGQYTGQVNSRGQSKIVFAAYDNWTASSKPSSVQLWTTDLNTTAMSLTANFSEVNTYINSETLRVSNNMVVTGTSTFNGLGTFNAGITETSSNGITATTGPVSAPMVVTDKLYNSSTSLTDNKPFLDTTYYTSTDTTAIDFKNITSFDVYNKTNSRRVIRTDTINSKGCIYLTAHDNATNGTYAQADNASTHGVYIEGTSSNTAANTTSPFTVVTNNTYEEWIINGSNGTAYTHHQVGIDIVCGKGIRDETSIYDPDVTTRKDEPTPDTKYIRFYAPYRGDSLNADYGDPSKWDKIVVGKIFGNSNGGITYHSSFTGQHASIIDKSETLKEGMIVASTGQIWHGNTMDTALPKVQVSTKANDKTVFGVLHVLEGRHDGYVSASPPKETEQHIEVNSIGEGRILVTNFGGNIENGDYITSSVIGGYGMKQEDDLLHSYTVAKCTENINWENITDTIEHNGQTYKVYLSACTYHCG